MPERIVVTEPFETEEEAADFFAVLKAQMDALGYDIEPAPSSGGIDTGAIWFNVDDPRVGENFGNARLVISSGHMAIEVAGNIFAERNIAAVAQGLGLSHSVAFELAASAMLGETETGRPVLTAIVTNVE